MITLKKFLEPPLEYITSLEVKIKERIAIYLYVQELSLTAVQRSNVTMHESQVRVVRHPKQHIIQGLAFISITKAVFN